MRATSYLYLGAALLFFSCTALLSNRPPDRTRTAASWHPSTKTTLTEAESGCLISALEMQAIVQAHDSLEHSTWARIVRIVYRERWAFEGHALLCFKLSGGDVYAFDALHGSVPLHTASDDIDTIQAKLKHYYPTTVFAEFLD